jgi:putative ABC transport system permease protein
MQDLRFAFRHLRQRPGFTVVAVLTLALGIGANAAVFSVSSAVLLAPLPYDRPDDVVVLNEQLPQFASISVTRYNYEDWRQRAESFAGMAAFRPTSMTVTGTGDPERVPLKMVTATLLPLLGVAIERGRGFSAADDRPGAENVAILGAGFAQRRLGGQDPLGRTMLLDNRPFTVIGVMPARFELFEAADVYVPFGPWAATLPEDRGWHPGIFPIARLKPGVSIEQARVEMETIARQLEAEHPDSNTNIRALVTRAQDQLVRNVRPALMMLTGAVLLVLLIGCANVANLLLARAVDRQKEIAVRLALGAGRRRIVRQLVVESVALSCTGGLAGVLLAAWGISLLTATSVPGLPRAQNVAVEWPVVLFALALSVLTGIVFGLVPAMRATQLPLREALNEEGRGGSAGARHRRLRSRLVIAEIALALVLLVGAGLLLRSFATLTRVSPGFRRDNLLVVNLPLSPLKYRASDTRTAVVERIIARVRSMPGVQNAGSTPALPMAGAGATIHFNRAAYPPKSPDDYVMAGFRAVTPGYRATLGIPLRRGRFLTDADNERAPRVVVVNESMARQYFPDRDALGQRIQLGTEPSPDDPTMEIVGIVGDVKQGFEAGAKAEMFVPYGQFPDPILSGMYLNTALVVRTANDPTALTPALRAAINEIDPDQPLVNVRTMEGAMAGTVAQPRLQMVLLMIFGSLAALLAGVGVYGVMAYAVLQRVPEIGVRMAIGASPGQVVAMVVREGAVLIAKGLGLGLVVAAIAGGAMQSLLFNVSGLDPFAYAGAAVILGVAALVAGYVPARRAARVSPLSALGR